MAEYDDIFSATDEWLNDTLDTQEKRIAKAMRRLERRIIDAAKELPSDGKTIKFTAGANREFQKSLTIAINEEFGGLADKSRLYADDLIDRVLGDYASMNVGVEFSTVSKKMITALNQQTMKAFDAVSADVQEKISQGLYDAVLGGNSFADFTDIIRNALTGVETMGGTAAAVYAERIAHDNFMEYFARMNSMIAKDANLSHYIYSGNIIGSSRAFCIARAGKVFNKKTIKSWESYNWKGKKRGDIFIVRGGYNCRHTFRPIEKEWVDGGKIEVGNYFDENPKAYRPKLRKEVDKELKRL